jgi:hypothetical protein
MEHGRTDAAPEFVGIVLETHDQDAASLEDVFACQWPAYGQ